VDTQVGGRKHSANPGRREKGTVPVGRGERLSLVTGLYRKKGTIVHVVLTHERYKN